MSPQYRQWSSGPVAADGIKAKSKRGAIGEQWWSQRFLEVLESWGMRSRLQRGRTYARKGQVLNFTVAAGKVTARVQGSRPSPYKVTITVAPLSAAQWRKVEDRLAAQALFRARLLAGEMPAEIEEVFKAAGTPLFPASSRDMSMDCSCPDWEVPCKHLAAVCYVLAEAFDEDPFGMLAWRGKGREDLLSALRGRGADPGPGSGAAPGSADGAAAGGSPAQALLRDVVGPPLEKVTGDFWAPGLSQARLRALPAVPAAPPDLLLRLAGPAGITVRGTDLTSLLAAGYARLADGAGTAGQDAPGDPAPRQPPAG